MPESKNASTRYMILDRCLSNRVRTYTFEELREEIQTVLAEEFAIKRSKISVSTLRKDLAHLKKLCAGYTSITCRLDPKREAWVYQYADRNFSLYSSASPHELQALKDALKVLRTIKGFPQAEGLFEVLKGMFDRLNMPLEYQDWDANPFFSFEQIEGYEGWYWVSDLYKAIYYKRPQMIEYQPFDSDAYQILFHPYRLREYNNRLFVYGFNTEKDRLEVLALDRIQDVKEKPYETFVPNRFVQNWERYFADFVGVMSPEKPKERIRIRVYGKGIHYIRTKPIHSSHLLPGHEISNSDGSFDLILEVIPTREIINRILEYGDQIEVVEPPYLRERLRGIVSNMSEFYQRG